MIRYVQPLASGNAIRLILGPPAGAEKWALLRKEADNFTGHDDPAAVRVLDGDLTSVVDHYLVMNDIQYFYRVYYLIADNWIDGGGASGMASAAFTDDSTDVLLILRDRLEYGLAVQVQQGVFSHEYGKIPVLTAPPVFEDTRWPVVTVHLDNESSSVRSIGETMVRDFYDDEEELWSGTEGWLADVSIQIVGWSLNPDERNQLRRAIRAVIQSNLSLFDFEGMINIDVSQRDTEDFTSYSAPVYQSSTTFTCKAPAQVRTTDDNVIRTVDTSVSLVTEG